MRKILVVLGIVLILGTIGALSGPRWQPVPVQHQVDSVTEDTTIGSSATTTPEGTYEVDTEVFEVELDGTTVTAQVTYPIGAPEDAPGMLFMHGAGTAGHRNFTDQAQSLASAGVYVLVPAKRMDTYTLRHRDYPQMADDYMHSLEELRQWPGVDPDRVGIYGESEGAYIAAVAAADYEQVAFTVLVSATVVPPRQEDASASYA